MTLQENATTESRPARKFTPANLQKIKDWVAEGISREEIAKSLHVTVGSLQVTCSRLGISLRRRDASGPGGPRTVRPPYLPSHPLIAGQRHAGTCFQITLECNGTRRTTELPLSGSAIGQLKLEADLRNLSMGQLLAEVANPGDQKGDDRSDSTRARPDFTRARPGACSPAANRTLVAAPPDLQNFA